jgi:hypothetical protein
VKKNELRIAMAAPPAGSLRRRLTQPAGFAYLSNIDLLQSSHGHPLPGYLFNLPVTAGVFSAPPHSGFGNICHGG